MISRSGREFETEHVVDEDLAVEVGFLEAVGRRIEIAFRRMLFDAERIEIGVQMAARAVGADQHDGLHRVAGRLQHLLGRERDALIGRLAVDLVADAACRRGSSRRRARP